MLVILLLILGTVLITILTRLSIKWIVGHNFLQKYGDMAVVIVTSFVTLMLLLLKFLMYQNSDNFYLAYFVVGIILGIIFGMLPKSNNVVVNIKKKWFIHAVVLEFLLIIYAFASLFFCIEIIAVGSFEGYTPWNNFFLGVLEFLYYSISVFSTAGFGDIHPVSAVAKIAVCAELLVMFRTITLGAIVFTKTKNEISQ